eukprot:1101951-Amphidinium_carterae.1
MEAPSLQTAENCLLCHPVQHFASADQIQKEGLLTSECVLTLRPFHAAGNDLVPHESFGVLHQPHIADDELIQKLFLGNSLADSTELQWLVRQVLGPDRFGQALIQGDPSSPLIQYCADFCLARFGDGLDQTSLWHPTPRGSKMRLAGSEELAVHIPGACASTHAPTLLGSERDMDNSNGLTTSTYSELLPCYAALAVFSVSHWRVVRGWQTRAARKMLKPAREQCLLCRARHEASTPRA